MRLSRGLALALLACLGALYLLRTQAPVRKGTDTVNNTVVSPDGRRLALRFGSQTYVVGGSGTAARPLGEAMPLSWSPDGRYLLARLRTPLPKKIGCYDVTQDALRVASWLPPNVFMCWWSPTGDTLACVRFGGAPGAEGRMDLAVASPRARARSLLPGWVSVDGCAWSRDGSSLYAWGNPGDGRRESCAVVRVEPGDGAVHDVLRFEGAALVALSPDHTKILYYGERMLPLGRRGPPRVMRFDLTSGKSGRVPLGKHWQPGVLPVWSATSEAVYAEDAKSSIWRIPLTQGAGHPVLVARLAHLVSCLGGAPRVVLYSRVRHDAGGFEVTVYRLDERTLRSQVWAVFRPSRPGSGMDVPERAACPVVEDGPVAMVLHSHG